MAQLVEPALGRWRFPPLIDVWRRRLRDDRVDRRRRMLAIRGLGEMRDEAAADDLLQLAVPAAQPADFRLAAATALGQIRRSGLEAASRRLLTGQPPPDIVDRLVAVRLLALARFPAGSDVPRGNGGRRGFHRDCRGTATVARTGSASNRSAGGADVGQRRRQRAASGRPSVAGLPLGRKRERCSPACWPTPIRFYGTTYGSSWGSSPSRRTGGRKWSVKANGCWATPVGRRWNSPPSCWPRWTSHRRRIA